MRLIKGIQGAVFGIVDGFIMLSGIIASVYRATSDPKLVIMAGVTAAVADSLANAVGFYASELAERGQQIHARTEHGENTSIHSKEEILMSVIFSLSATPLALIVPLIPFLFIPVSEAILLSLSIAMSSLFLLGYYIGKLARENPVKTGLKYALMGMLGATICYIVGDLIKKLTGL